MKGVISHGGRVLLLKNERDEWELPGGRLEAGESLHDCLRREIYEETNLHVEVGPLLDVRVYEVISGRYVLIVSFGCRTEDFESLKVSREHLEAGAFGVGEMDALRLPEVYRESVRSWTGVIS